MTFSVTPTTLTFVDTVGTLFGAQTVNIAATGGAPVTGLAIDSIIYAAGASDWLTFQFSGAEAPATLTLQPSGTSLSPGTYAATVRVKSPVASNSPQTVGVSFTLVAAPPQPPDPPPPGPPPAPIPGVTIVAMGNIARCGGSLSARSAAVVANANPDFIFALGDNAYPQAGAPAGAATSLADYQACYDPLYGTFRARTYAAVGGREQDSLGMSAGADAYFGPANVGPAGRNYYSFNVGTGSARWHIIVLNILTGGPTVPVPYGNSSAQLPWLRDDLAANRDARCTLVFWHDPMWYSSNNTSQTDRNIGYRRQPQRGIWMALYNENVDVVLGGGDHIYERFAPMRYDDDTSGPEFAADSVRGIMQITSGLAGDGPMATPNVQFRHPLSRYRSGGVGVLKMTLGDGIYTWEFLNGTGSNVTDWGSGTCH